MKNVYEKGSALLVEFVNKVAQRYHPDLYALEPVIAILMVRKFDEDDNPYHALKHHGACAAATIKVTSTKKRALVDFDIELNIDGMTWDASSQETRIALIDHELNHIVIVRDSHNVPKKDDLGHYKYTCRPDDFAITGFFAVVERHGGAALEAQSIERIHDRMLIALHTAARQTAAVVVAAAA